MRKPTSFPACALILCLAATSLAWTPWSAIYGSARDERSLGDQATDTQISLTIKKAMADKDSGMALKVHVYCFVGHVFLVGAVDDLDFRAFAVKTAEATKDVAEVTDYFVPESDTTAGDLEIVAKVRTTLIGDGDLSSTQIEQEVFNGEVVLLGMVRTAQDARQAVKVAGEVMGVRKVTSFLIPSK